MILGHWEPGLSHWFIEDTAQTHFPSSCVLKVQLPLLSQTNEVKHRSWADQLLCLSFPPTPLWIPLPVRRYKHLKNIKPTSTSQNPLQRFLGSVREAWKTSSHVQRGSQAVLPRDPAFLPSEDLIISFVSQGIQPYSHRAAKFNQWQSRQGSYPGVTEHTFSPPV